MSSTVALRIDVIQKVRGEAEPARVLNHENQNSGRTRLSVHQVGNNDSMTSTRGMAIE